MFQITVSELTSPDDQKPVERFRQTVDELDMQGLIQAVNRKKRAPRSDRGKARTEANAKP